MGAESIGWKIATWLATYALHSTVLIATAWLAALALGRVARWRDFAAGIREWMWKLALLGGLATATAQVGFSVQTWRLEWFPADAERASVLEQPVVRGVAPVDVPTRVVDPLFAPVLLQIAALDVAERSEARFAPATITPPPPPARPIPWIEIALGIWLIGIVIGLVRWAREWQRLRHCVRGRVRIESGLVFRDLEALRARAGCTRRVRLSCAPGIAAPLTMGVFRAEICLPPRALRALQRDEIRAVLAHELAHAVRRDTAWLHLCRLLEIAFFFQPLNRVARRFLQQDVESLCDDWAVVHTGECVPLASSLTEIAGWLVGEHRRLPAPAMVVHGSALSHRVRRLLDEERAPVVLRGRFSLTAIATLCCAGAALALPGVSTTAHPDRELDVDALAIDTVDDTEASALDVSDVAAPPFLTAESPREPLPTPSGAIADLIPAAGGEPLELSAVLEEIDALEQSLDSLQAEVRLRGADDLKPRVDALAQRLDSLRAMRTRLGALLQLYRPWPLLDQP